MPVIILTMVLLVVFLNLTLQARRDPEKKQFFYLYLAIDFVLASLFVYLMITGLAS